MAGLHEPSTFLSGVGFSLCKRLLATHQNLQLYMLCRNQQRASVARGKLLRSCPEKSGVEVVLCDVSSPESVMAAADTVRDKVSHIDYLYLNAGIMLGGSVDWWALLKACIYWKWLFHMIRTGDGLLHQVDSRREDGLRQIFATNVFGHFLLLQEFRSLLKSCDGRVIWTSSRNAQRSVFNIRDIQHERGNTAYSSSKYVVDNLSYITRVHMEISSAVACPGLVLTNMAFGLLSSVMWYIIYPVLVMCRVVSDIFTLCPDHGAEALLLLSRLPADELDPTVKYCTVRGLLGSTTVTKTQLDIDDVTARKIYDTLEYMAIKYIQDLKNNKTRRN